MSAVANLSITSSSGRVCDNCFSMESKAKSVRRCSDIVERRKVFIMSLSAENDRAHCAVLTAIVRAICSSLTNVGKASFNK